MHWIPLALSRHWIGSTTLVCWFRCWMDSGLKPENQLTYSQPVIILMQERCISTRDDIPFVAVRIIFFVPAGIAISSAVAPAVCFVFLPSRERPFSYICMNISGGRSLTPIFRQNLIGSGIDETLNDTLLHFGLWRW